MNRTLKVKKSTIYSYILPGYIIFCFAMIIPIISAIVISFFNWSGGPKFQYIGLDNYIKIINDKDFWISFLHNLEFIAILMISQIGLSFFVALLLQSKFTFFKEFHRRVIFTPAVLSPIIVGMLWQLVYRTDIGLIASFLKKIGLESLIIQWLDDPNLVIPAICITLTWQFIGQFVIILTAGMQNISNAVIEAALIDGANAFQRAVKIILPLLKPTFVICMTICISGCMKMFAIVLAMSGGGPGYSSMISALYAYNLAFEAQKLGYASAVAIGIVLLSLVLILIMRLLMRGNDDND